MRTVDHRWRRTNLGHLLFAATGLCVGSILRALAAQGHPLTEAQLGLFVALDPPGTRLTALAARTGTTKQSTIELVDRAEWAGLVERNADPADTRAKLVRLTAPGEQLRRRIARQSASTADAMAARLGAERMEHVGRSLVRYLGAGDTPAAFDQLLSRAGRLFVREVLAGVHSGRHREITEALLALFRQLDPAGSRLTDLAAGARITKQSMGGLVARAEALGLVARAPDPADRRASLIRFTDAGLAMLDAFRDGVEAAERRFADRTGVDLPAFKAAMADMLAGDRVGG